METAIDKLTTYIVNLEKVISDIEKNASANSELRANVDWMKGVVEGIKQSIVVIKEDIA